MNNKLDNYNKLVDLIGNIIKATNNPNDQKDIDNAIDIAHIVGNTLKVIADKMIIKFYNMKMTTNNIPQGYKDSPLGIIPEEWEIKKLGEVCTFIKSGKNKEKSNEGLFHVFGSTGIIGFTNKYVYNCPLLLIARVGANAGFIYYINEKCDVSDNTLILRLNSSYDFIFAYNQLKQYNLNRLIFGSGQPLITASLLKNIKISFPPLPEQQKIAEVLSTWDKAIEKQSQLIEKLELRKKD